MVLVGLDFYGSHFFGEHPREFRVSTPWDLLRSHMGELAADLSREGVEIINCSPDSALTFWPKKSLAEAMASG